MNEKTAEQIKQVIISELKSFRWDILGIIDEKQNIFPMTSDTKVLSKVFEMKITPDFRRIASKLSVKGNPCTLVLAKEQNQYPDITLSGGILGDEKIAIDIKSAYRKGEGKFSGFTLGAFNGYFKNRNSTKNIAYPYKEYCKHWVLCFIYDRDRETDITAIHSLKDIKQIPKIITNVEIVLQDKWKVAKTTPGSGNTANIGGIDDIEKLKNGQGHFSSEGEEVFNDYWMHYIRKEDCNKIGLKEQPYTNLESYKKWVKEGRKGDKLIEDYYSVHDNNTESESDE